MVDAQRPTPEERRLSFGRGAQAYHRFRPTYPHEAVRFALGPDPVRVLDLGAGTGRLTQRLVELGHEVVAVEPDEQMLSVLQASNQVESHLGTAEQIPLPDGTVEAVVVGQAFHWFDQGKALPDIARVLRPNGVLGLLWNLLDDSVDWVARVCEITGNEGRMSLTEQEDDPQLSPWFTDMEHREVTHRRSGSLDELLGEVATWSYVNLREDRDDLLAQVREVATAAQGGDHGFPYVTSVFRAVHAP